MFGGLMNKVSSVVGSAGGALDVDDLLAKCNTAEAELKVAVKAPTIAIKVPGMAVPEDEPDVGAMVSQLLAPVLALVASVAAMFAMGPGMATAMLNVLINFAGTGIMWMQRSKGLFAKVNVVVEDSLDGIIESIDQEMDALKGTLIGCVGKIDQIVDTLSEQMGPALGKAKMVESSLDVDIPEPSDIKAPIKGAIGMVEARGDEVLDMIRKTGKGLTPEFMRDESQWFMYVTLIPLAGVLVMNSGVTFATVLAMAAAGGEDAAAAAGGAAAEAQSVLDPAALMPGVLAIAQAVVAIVFGKASVAIDKVSTVFERKMNKRINDELKDVKDDIFQAGFAQVQEAMKKFFPQMRSLLEKLAVIPGL